jgi:hypothetical protein
MDDPSTASQHLHNVLQQNQALHSKIDENDWKTNCFRQEMRIASLHVFDETGSVTLLLPEYP